MDKIEIVKNITEAVTKGGSKGKIDEVGNKYGVKKKLYIIEDSKHNYRFVIGVPNDQKILSEIGDTKKVLPNGILILKRYTKPSEIRFAVEKLLEHYENSSSSKSRAKSKSKDTSNEINKDKRKSKVSKSVNKETSKNDTIYTDVDITISTTQKVPRDIIAKLEDDIVSLVKQSNVSKYVNVTIDRFGEARITNK